MKITDVAAAAGVSATTVSHVLNDTVGARISPETRDRVRDAAARLGYTPNRLASGLRTSRTHTIGLVSDHVLTTPYAGRMILGAQDVAREAGFVLMLVSTGADEQLEQDAIRSLVDRQVDGLIYATMYHRMVQPPAQLAGRPSVYLNCGVTDQSAPSVVPDEERGGYDATRLLVEAGHRRIAYLGNSNPVRATELRQEGYCRALREAGLTIDPQLIVADEALRDGGQRATERLLSMTDRPTGVFVFNDRMALGVYRAARRAGLTIPDDLSVVGFDDQELIADELDPGLTTMALPHQAMGRWAARQLVQLTQISDSHEVHREARLEPCPPVLRESVGPPPGLRP